MIMYFSRMKVVSSSPVKTASVAKFQATTKREKGLCSGAGKGLPPLRRWRRAAAAAAAAAPHA